MRSRAFVISASIFSVFCLLVAFGCSQDSPQTPASGAFDISTYDGPLEGSRHFCDRNGILPVAAGIGDPSLNDIAGFKTVYATDYVTAGVGGLRNTGTGTIALSGVSGTVTEAYLYWHGPTDSVDPAANANVLVNGNAVVGANIGFSSDNCWGFDNSQAYRADVTALVSAGGNGNYVLSGFGDGTPVNSNGASLLVFFDDGDPFNDRDVVIFEGNDSNASNAYDADGWNVSLAGIDYDMGTAYLELHVADGQYGEAYVDGELVLNAGTLEPTGQIFSGTSVPSANNGPLDNGSLWDIRRWDVTSYLSPGLNNLVLTSDIFNDCLGLIVAVANLPAGDAPDQPQDAFFTGGGFFFGPEGGRITFGFNAGPRFVDGPVSGHLTLVDHFYKGQMKTTGVDFYTNSGDCATFAGPCEVNHEEGWTYLCYVCDHDEPGKDIDEFYIRLFNPDGDLEYTRGGVIDGGNIQKHDLMLPVGDQIAHFED